MSSFIRNNRDFVLSVCAFLFGSVSIVFGYHTVRGIMNVLCALQKMF